MSMFYMQGAKVNKTMEHLKMAPAFQGSVDVKVVKRS
jgi:hypothetical protein